MSKRKSCDMEEAEKCRNGQYSFLVGGHCNQGVTPQCMFEEMLTACNTIQYMYIQCMYVLAN